MFKNFNKEILYKNIFKLNKIYNLNKINYYKPILRNFSNNYQIDKNNIQEIPDKLQKLDPIKVINDYLLIIRDSETISNHLNELFVDYKHDEMIKLFNETKKYDISLSEDATRHLIHIFCKKDNIEDVIFLYNQYRDYNNKISDEICNEIIRYYSSKNNDNKIDSFYNSIKMFNIPLTERSVIHHYHIQNNYNKVKEIVDYIVKNNKTLSEIGLEEYTIFCLETCNPDDLISVYLYHQELNINSKTAYSNYIGALFQKK